MALFPYYLGYLFPLLVIFGIETGGFGYYWVLIGIFIGIPILDASVGTSPRRLTAAEEEKLKASVAFRWVTFIYVPLQCLLIGFGAYSASQFSLHWYEFFGIALSVGAVTGALGITYAHELLHQKNILEKILAKILLVSVHYAHFSIEHVVGHHTQVATAEDYATARKGEVFYQFWLRSVFGGFKNSWKHKRYRLKILTGVILSTLVAITLGWMWGLKAVLFFYLQSLVAITLLELTNYLQHYGLVRQKNGTRYAPVRAQHSWDSEYTVSNNLLLQLGRHADHHQHPTKRYQGLTTMDSPVKDEVSPKMPYGFALMVLLPLVPPLWFKIMDPLVPDNL